MSPERNRRITELSEKMMAKLRAQQPVCAVSMSSVLVLAQAALDQLDPVKEKQLGYRVVARQVEPEVWQILMDDELQGTLSAKALDCWEMCYRSLATKNDPR